MFVWIAAIFTLLFYISAVPVKFALTLRLSSRSSFGAGASVFEGRYALKNSVMRARGEKAHLPWKMAELDLQKTAVLPAAFRAAKYLLKHLHLETLQAHGRICAPDAAQTALICGCAQSIEGTLLPFTSPGAVQLRLQPDFSAGQSDVSICGMVSVCTGHIILAALIGAWNYLTRRISHGKASD